MKSNRRLKTKLSLRDLTKDKSWQSQKGQAERLLRFARNDNGKILIPVKTGIYLLLGGYPVKLGMTR